MKCVLFSRLILPDILQKLYPSIRHHDFVIHGLGLSLQNSTRVYVIDRMSLVRACGEMSLQGPLLNRQHLMMHGLTSSRGWELRIGLMNLETKWLRVPLETRPVQSGWIHMISKYS